MYSILISLVVIFLSVTYAKCEAPGCENKCTDDTTECDILAKICRYKAIHNPPCNETDCPNGASCNQTLNKCCWNELKPCIQDPCPAEQYCDPCSATCVKQDVSDQLDNSTTSSTTLTTPVILLSTSMPTSTTTSSGPGKKVTSLIINVLSICMALWSYKGM